MMVKLFILNHLDLKHSVVKDLVVDRSSFDRIQQAGGYISVNTSGNTQDANALPIPKADADLAMDAATCIDVDMCCNMQKFISYVICWCESFSICFITSRSS